MKLRNKKTGEIEDVSISVYETTGDIAKYKTLAELNAEWEDYIPKEPLIKDEKIRKVVRLLFDIWGVNQVKIDASAYFLVSTIEALGKGYKFEIPNININGVFGVTELCGEEE